MEDSSSNSKYSDKSIRPIAIVSRLLQVVATMEHVDELFLWMANSMVQRFDVAAAQIWALQAYSTGEVSGKLRASVSQHAFYDLQVFESAEVSTFVEKKLREKQGILSIPVTNLFSRQYAALLVKQDCRYWTMYFLRENVFLPPPQKQPEQEELYTPLQMMFSFFTREPLQPAHTRAISFLVEQSLRIALSHGLLSTTSEKVKEAFPFTLAHLIPEHTQATEVEQSENPFSSAVVIAEKKVRQMYNLIDGKRNVEEMMVSMHVDKKEALEILQSLLAKRYILLREVGGGFVEISAFPHAF
jgi:hypothetical protein